MADLAPRLLGREDRTGAALAAQVSHLSELYTRERQAIELAGRDAAARLRFFFLRDLPKIQGPLAELAAVGALPAGEVWRVLDVGAGYGTSFLGAAELATRAGAARLEVTVLEARRGRARRDGGARAGGREGGADRAHADRGAPRGPRVGRALGPAPRGPDPGRPHPERALRRPRRPRAGARGGRCARSRRGSRRAARWSCSSPPPARSPAS
ncbi:MAG: hypothetical protein M5U28_01485 [Sandaracinaceae bacterium]|nr:hypothetical protein [Sandaracinaceae bacterium]